MSDFAVAPTPASCQPAPVDETLVPYRENLKLVLLLLEGDHHAAADRLQGGSLHGDEFARFVEEHWLQLFVFSLLQGSPTRQWLPFQWVNNLKRSSLGQWARQERLVQELMRVSALLADAGQPFILLKGPYVATRFFGGVDRRAFADLDILIRRENFTAVDRVLRASGYLRKSSTFLSRRLTTYFAHSFDFVGPNVALDLHWKFAAPPYRLDYESVWQQARTFTLRSRDFLVLSDEYEVVFHLLSIFKDLEMGIARLRAFVDLYVILSKIHDQLDWDTFFEHRKRERVLRIVVNVLELFFQLFDCRERFPAPAMLIADEQKRRTLLPTKDYRALLEAAPGAAWNKMWASRLYECSRITLLSWWVLSYPFRLAVYQPPKYVEFKRRLERVRYPLRLKLAGLPDVSAKPYSSAK